MTDQCRGCFDAFADYAKTKEMPDDSYYSFRGVCSVRIIGCPEHKRQVIAALHWGELKEDLHEQLIEAEKHATEELNK